MVAHRVNVQIGQGSDDWIMVNGLIKAGDQIIVRGGERLEDGQLVRLSDDSLEQNVDLNVVSDAGHIN